MMMPVMNGWELMNALAQRERLARIPVVVLSAQSDAPPGTVAFLRKPIDLDRLLATIRSAAISTAAVPPL
jgi:CheY-like chemotaxis protein